ncbi:MAG: hypothetical protein EAZ64_05995 [Sphingobacteriales bacterium]|nr:MAG: hypothetical protein EAZ64_05995 [Sphingobacteriales bacterium]
MPPTTGKGNYSTINTNYRELLSYDANGNILTLLRNGTNTQQDMDNLSYNYKAGTNQLSHVADAVAAGNYPADLDSQQPNNYSYDKIGNLLSDASEGITNIDWNVYGKIKTIAKPTGNINYTYDPAGNRQSKTLNTGSTYYVRDAQGNTLATYEDGTWAEQYLYGSSRIGMWKPTIDMNLATPTAGSDKWKQAGLKQYELTNHLGNVLTTISDKRKGIDTNADGIVDYYTADVTTAQDYYPGGMPQPGRGYVQNSAKMRFGFNGMENDNEVAGRGNHLSFGDYGYSPRIVRRWNLDPMGYQEPGLTPYQFGFNNPINFADPDGRWPELPTWGSIKKSYNVAKTSIARNYNTAVAVSKGAYNATARAISQSAVVTQKWTAKNKGSLLSVAKSIQETGDKAATIGAVAAIAGAPVAGVGAAPGASLAAVGAIVSGIGAGMEVAVELIGGSSKNAVITLGNEAGYKALSKLGDAAIDAAVPGNLPDMSSELKEGMKQAAGLLNDGVKDKTNKVIDNYRDKAKDK